jgi:hypothetical protein
MLIQLYTKTGEKVLAKLMHLLLNSKIIITCAMADCESSACIFSH